MIPLGNSFAEESKRAICETCENRVGFSDRSKFRTQEKLCEQSIRIANATRKEVSLASRFTLNICNALFPTNRCECLEK